MKEEKKLKAARKRARKEAAKQKEIQRRALNPNPMVSRYSHKYPFPGAVKSRNGGYDPAQFYDR